MRGTILQPWNYYSPREDESGLKLWKRLKRDAALIKQQGFTAVWLPPTCISMGGENSVGYSISHWSDFNNTKYGNEQELKEACAALKDAGVQVYHDTVHNHLMGGELESGVWCLHVSNADKNKPAHAWATWHQRDMYTSFPKLGVDHHHFDCIHEGQWYVLSGKKFDLAPNQDALMGCDLDFDSIELVEKLKEHGRKNLAKIHTDGYRYDAVKHIRPKGTLGFHKAMEEEAQKGLFGLGEYSDDNICTLENYINQTEGKLSVYDFPLQRKLVHASMKGLGFDMGAVLNDTLVQRRPCKAVTFVGSHDDQPAMHDGEPRGHYVGDWFKSQAYAIILLREQGYPCVSNVDMIKDESLILKMMKLRNNCTYGERMDRFDHYSTIGWSYAGGYHYDNSMAVVLTRGGAGYKWLKTGKPNTKYRDFMDKVNEDIWTNNDGWGCFKCVDESTSVWVEESKYLSMQ